MTDLYALISAFGCGCCAGAWLGVSAIAAVAWVLGNVEREEVGE